MRGIELQLQAVFYLFLLFPNVPVDDTLTWDTWDCDGSRHRYASCMHAFAGSCQVGRMFRLQLAFDDSKMELNVEWGGE